MRRDRFFTLRPGIILVSLLLAATAADEARAQGGPEQAAEGEIRKLEAEFNEAIVKADLEAFDRLMADDFTHTNQSGKFRTKAEWLANHKPGRSAYDAFEVDDLDVRVYGDAAVVTARSTPKGRTSTGEPITGQFRFLRVWARRDGRWQAVAFHGTRIAEP